MLDYYSDDECVNSLFLYCELRHRSQNAQLLLQRHDPQTDVTRRQQQKNHTTHKHNTDQTYTTQKQRLSDVIYMWRALITVTIKHTWCSNMPSDQILIYRTVCCDGDCCVQVYLCDHQPPALWTSDYSVHFPDRPHTNCVSVHLKDAHDPSAFFKRKVKNAKNEHVL